MQENIMEGMEVDEETSLSKEKHESFFFVLYKATSYLDVPSSISEWSEGICFRPVMQTFSQRRNFDCPKWHIGAF